MDRRYSVAEIDALRRVAENMYLYGDYSPSGTTYMSRTYQEADKYKAVEEMVRTHMLAGHTAEDLIQHSREQMQEIVRKHSPMPAPQ